MVGDIVSINMSDTRSSSVTVKVVPLIFVIVMVNSAFASIGSSGTITFTKRVFPSSKLEDGDRPKSSAV